MEPDNLYHLMAVVSHFDDNTSVYISEYASHMPTKIIIYWSVAQRELGVNIS